MALQPTPVRYLWVFYLGERREIGLTAQLLKRLSVVGSYPILLKFGYDAGEYLVDLLVDNLQCWGPF